MVFVSFQTLWYLYTAVYFCQLRGLSHLHPLPWRWLQLYQPGAGEWHEKTQTRVGPVILSFAYKCYMFMHCVHCCVCCISLLWKALVTRFIVWWSRSASQGGFRGFCQGSGVTLAKHGFFVTEHIKNRFKKKKKSCVEMGRSALYSSLLCDSCRRIRCLVFVNEIEKTKQGKKPCNWRCYHIKS